MSQQNAHSALDETRKVSVSDMSRVNSGNNMVIGPMERRVSFSGSPLGVRTMEENSMEPSNSNNNNNNHELVSRVEESSLQGSKPGSKTSWKRSHVNSLIKECYMILNMNPTIHIKRKQLVDTLLEGGFESEVLGQILIFTSAQHPIYTKLMYYVNSRGAILKNKLAMSGGNIDDLSEHEKETLFIYDYYRTVSTKVSNNGGEMEALDKNTRQLTQGNKVQSNEFDLSGSYNPMEDDDSAMSSVIATGSTSNLTKDSSPLRGTIFSDNDAENFKLRSRMERYSTIVTNHENETLKAHSPIMDHRWTTKPESEVSHDDSRLNPNEQILSNTETLNDHNFPATEVPANNSQFRRTNSYTMDPSPTNILKRLIEQDRRIDDMDRKLDRILYEVSLLPVRQNQFFGFQSSTPGFNMNHPHANTGTQSNLGSRDVSQQQHINNPNNNSNNNNTNNNSNRNSNGDDLDTLGSDSDENNLFKKPRVDISDRDMTNIGNANGLNNSGYKPNSSVDQLSLGKDNNDM